MQDLKLRDFAINAKDWNTTSAASIAHSRQPRKYMSMSTYVDTHFWTSKNRGITMEKITKQLLALTRQLNGFDVNKKEFNVNSLRPICLAYPLLDLQIPTRLGNPVSLCLC